MTLSLLVFFTEPLLHLHFFFLFFLSTNQKNKQKEKGKKKGKAFPLLLPPLFFTLFVHLSFKIIIINVIRSETN